jgi:hypothetical protein
MVPLLALLLAAGPASQPGLGVSDFAPAGASPELAQAVSGVTANELQRLGVFKVSTADSMRALLGLERQRQILGCGTDCQNVDLKGLVGYDFLVTGKVTRLGGGRMGPATFTLEMALLDTRTSSRLSSELVTTKSEAELVAAVGPAVLRLVGKILSGKQGSLIVSATEAGAAVSIDGTQLGVTPLDGRLKLAAGPHLLSVAKEGYVTWQKEVRIAPDEMIEEQAKLMPSPDTIEAYETKASRMRVGAMISTGLAIAGAGTFGFMQYRAQQLYGSDDSQAGTFRYHASLVKKGVEEEPGVNHREQASVLSTQIKNSQMLGTVGAGVFGAGAAVATYLWIAGDSPGRYDRFKERVEVTGVSLAPGAGSPFAVLMGRF